MNDRYAKLLAKAEAAADVGDFTAAEIYLAIAQEIRPASGRTKPKDKTNRGPTS